MAFEIAAKGAFRGHRQVRAQAPGARHGSRRHHPDSMGDVIGDLNSRRGAVNELGDKPGSMKTVKAFVPLAEMFNYVSKLRGILRVAPTSP